MRLPWYFTATLAVGLIALAGCATTETPSKSASMPPARGEMASPSEIPPHPDETTDASVVPPTDDGSGQAIPLKNLPTKKLRGVAYPYGIRTKWTKSDGLVKSPYAQDKQLIDVSKYAPGDPVRCPHTGKIFIVP